MMNFNDFINKQVKNNAGEVGLVISIDKEYTVIKYENNEKTYNTDIVFKNKYLCFVNENDDKEMDNYVNHRVDEEIKKQQLFKDNDRKSIVRQHKVHALYKKMRRKNSLMLRLFGDDFVYPPYEEFKKKYKYQINESWW